MFDKSPSDDVSSQQQYHQKLSDKDQCAAVQKTAVVQMIMQVFCLETEGNRISKEPMTSQKQVEEILMLGLKDGVAVQQELAFQRLTTFSLRRG